MRIFSAERHQQQQRTETLRKGQELLARVALKGSAQVEADLGIRGHELLLEFDIPTKKTGEKTHRSFFAFRAVGQRECGFMALQLSMALANIPTKFVGIYVPDDVITLIDEYSLAALAKNGKKTAQEVEDYGYDNLGPVYTTEIRQPVVIGRGEDAAFASTFDDDDTLASRIHAEIANTPEGVKITDLSRNGTTVTYMA